MVLYLNINVKSYKYKIKIYTQIYFSFILGKSFYFNSNSINNKKKVYKFDYIKINDDN